MICTIRVFNTRERCIAGRRRKKSIMDKIYAEKNVYHIVLRFSYLVVFGIWEELL